MNHTFIYKLQKIRIYIDFNTYIDLNTYIDRHQYLYLLNTWYFIPSCKSLFLYFAL